MSEHKTTYRAFVAVTPGLEEPLLEELSALELGRKPVLRRGGVELLVERVDLWRLVHSSRLAESVRVRVGRFKAHNFDELRAGLSRCPWAAYLRPGGGFRTRVTTRRSALYHSGAVEAATEEALRRYALDASTDVRDDGQASVYLRLVDDEVAVSVDASGELLHRRGYRRHVGKAPLRETLAAACVYAAHLSNDGVIWDPFCGSGTIVIEAMLSRRGGSIAPGRRHAFEVWPTHDEVAYGSFVASLPRGGTSAGRGVGSDIDPAEIAAAEHNAEAARAQSSTRFFCADFEDAEREVPQGAAVVTNLPYGHRTRIDRSQDGAYARFGRLLSRRNDLGPVVVLSGDYAFQSASGLRWRQLRRFTNRGLPVALLQLERDNERAPKRE